MASEFDQSDFIDSDFQSAKRAAFHGPGGGPNLVAGRPPTREELESKVGEMQQKLVDLKRAQENLERERATLEEARRRQTEFQTGRSEMLQHLTRGIGLLEKSEFSARRDAEQMAKTLAAFREVMAQLENIRQEAWTTENYNSELTRALTTIENSRMEWNSARLKWPILSGTAPATEGPEKTDRTTLRDWAESLSFSQMCKIGFALTWPLALVALAAAVTLLVILFRR